jgi:hypothetical protein
MPNIGITLDKKVNAADEPAKVSGSEPASLEAFVGKWTTEGQAHDSPFGPASRITAVESYEWLPGGLFLIHRLEGHLGNQPMACLEMTCTDAAHQRYAVQSFYNDGKTNEWRAQMHDDTWISTGNWTSEGKTTTVRCTSVFSDNGTTLIGKWEYSRDRLTWTLFWDTTSRKA